MAMPKELREYARVLREIVDDERNRSHEYLRILEARHQNLMREVADVDAKLTHIMKVMKGKLWKLAAEK